MQGRQAEGAARPWMLKQVQHDGPCRGPPPFSQWPPRRPMLSVRLGRCSFGARPGMATEFASEGEAAAGFRLRLPQRIPDFGPRAFLLFRFVWFAAFALALLGPVAGSWHRITEASRNSALVAGSRAGIALAEDDLTRIRFPVGRAAAAAGIRPGDEIVAIDTIPVSRQVVLPGSPAAAGGAGTETDQLLFGDLLSGTEDRDVTLTLRSPDGREHEVSLRTGEVHIAEGARALGVAAGLLGFIDLIHLLTYPFLLIAASLLFRRKREDVVSSGISPAILLTMATEQPSATFLAPAAG